MAQLAAGARKVMQRDSKIDELKRMFSNSITLEEVYTSVTYDFLTPIV